MTFLIDDLRKSLQASFNGHAKNISSRIICILILFVKVDGSFEVEIKLCLNCTRCKFGSSTPSSWL